MPNQRQFQPDFIFQVIAQALNGALQMIPRSGDNKPFKRLLDQGFSALPKETHSRAVGIGQQPIRIKCHNQIARCIQHPAKKVFHFLAYVLFLRAKLSIPYLTFARTRGGIL